MGENTMAGHTAVEEKTFQSWASTAFEQSVSWSNVAEHLKSSGDPLWMLADSSATMLRVFSNAAGRRAK